MAGADAELDALAERLRALRIEADDLGGELRRYAEGLEAEPGRLEEVEARLELLRPARAQARRHGRGGARARRALPRASSSGSSSSEARLERARGGARRGARPRSASSRRELTAARRSGRAEAGEARCSPSCAQLAMEDAAFEVALEQREALGPAGAERVEFVIAPEPGRARRRRCARPPPAASCRA